MSERDGTVLSDNPAMWDIERIARLDWGYIRQCIVKAGLQVLENPEPAYVKATDTFVKCLRAAVDFDEVRRGREEVEQLQELERRIDDKLKEIRSAARGGNVGTPTDSQETPSSH